MSLVRRRVGRERMRNRGEKKEWKETGLREEGLEGDSEERRMNGRRQ